MEIKLLWRKLLLALYRPKFERYTVEKMVTTLEIKRNKEDIIKYYKKRMVQELAEKLYEDGRMEFTMIPQERMGAIELRLRILVP